MKLNFSILNQNILQNSFTPIQSDLLGMKLYGRKIADYMYICCLIDPIKQWQITPEQLKDTSSKIEGKFLSQECSQVNLLYVVFSENPEEDKKLIGEDYKMWVVNLRTLQMIVCEGQPKAFLGIENAISQFLIEQKTHNIVVQNPKPIATAVLIIFNIFIFVLMELNGSTLDPDYVLQWGAVESHLVIEQHEYYRLFAGIFLHSGVEYLLGNIFLLHCFGSIAEHYIPKIRLLLFYVISGVAASISFVIYFYYVKEAYHVLPGAFGGTFGLWGVMVGTICASKGKVGGFPPLFAIVTSIIILFIDLGDAFSVMQIGGFATGVVLGVMNQLQIWKKWGEIFHISTGK